MKTDYDVIVIGGGAAGLTATGMAALLGAKTALIERERLGGECTWTGCIPSKCLLHAASVAQTLRTADQFGFEPQAPQFSFGDVYRRMHAVQQQIYEEADAPPNMEKLGVEVIRGEAGFVDPRTVEVNGVALRARYFVIATGSDPVKPTFHAPVLTNDNLFQITEQPGRLLVAGAGPVGIEMAQAFRRLGSDVTVIAPQAEILPRDDEELAGMLRERLEREGIRFRLGMRVEGAEARSGVTTATLSDGATVECDAVLAAMGRKARIESLRLDRAGVRTEKRGVVVDSHCRTSVRHIFAVGDVAGRYQFTHMAEHMAKVAITNCLLRWPQSIDEAHVPWCTFTSPELARVGNIEREINARQPATVLRFPFRKLDRAMTDGETDGMVKAIVNRRGRILGASILGARAGELIATWSLAMRKGLSVSDIAATIHPYPTYALANRRAADRWAERHLDSPLLGVLGRVFGYRGVRKGSGAL